MGHVLVAMAMVAGLVGVPVALSLVSTVPASAVAAAPMAPPGACGHVQLAGSARLGGHGVDVKSNGPDQGSGTSCGGMNKVDGITTGPEWQCVELVNRLYVTKGWIKATWPGNGGRSSPSARDSMYDEAPSSLSKQANGSVGYVGPGDVVSINVYHNGVFQADGHVLIVNTTSTIASGTFALVSQNGGDASDVVVTSSARLSHGTLTIPASGAWSYRVIGVVHAPSGTGGSTAYVANAGTDRVTPIATATNKAEKAIKVGSSPDAIAITSDEKTAYVANGGSDTVTPITTATNKAGMAIKVGDSVPGAMAITPDGKTAYIANDSPPTVTPITTQRTRRPELAETPGQSRSPRTGRLPTSSTTSTPIP